MRKKCEAIMPQMYHCRQCRADAIGTLDQDLSRTLDDASPTAGAAACEAAGGADSCPAARETAERPLRFAVASNKGYVVDQHFGHARGFYIYEYRNGRVSLLEKRDIPQYCFGPDGCRDHAAVFEAIAEIITDCAGVIAMRMGEAPRSMLAQRGVRFFMTYNYVTDAVKAAAEELLKDEKEPLPDPIREQPAEALP
jgi:predicted Fe-Mo cluster-binding NifX family protein